MQWTKAEHLAVTVTKRWARFWQAYKTHLFQDVRYNEHEQGNDMPIPGLLRLWIRKMESAPDLMDSIDWLEHVKAIDHIAGCAMAHAHAMELICKVF